MGFRLTVGTDMEMGERQIKNVQFRTEIPQDSNARATDHGASMKIWGKMLFSLEDALRNVDQSLELANWSQDSSDNLTCYRDVKVQVIAAGQVVREIELPNAFVVEYTETLDDENGVGEFYLHVKQKKDVTAAVVVTGGFPAE